MSGMPASVLERFGLPMARSSLSVAPAFAGLTASGNGEGCVRSHTHVQTACKGELPTHIARSGNRQHLE